MKPFVAIALAASLLSAGLLSTGGPAMAATNQELAKQVKESEQAFAKTMADRKFGAFADYVAKEAIFFGGRGPLRGRDAVVGSWMRFFEAPAAPFSWEPETVEVLDSGTLALTSGPVHDPDGKVIGTFNSIWRLESDGRWRVVFDKGCPVCEPAAPTEAPKKP